MFSFVETLKEIKEISQQIIGALDSVGVLSYGKCIIISVYIHPHSSAHEWVKNIQQSESMTD